MEVLLRRTMRPRRILESLSAAGHVPRESKVVLDLTEQDFQNISNVTGRIFEIGVHRSCNGWTS
jgi:hypothetical protein